MYRFDIMTLFPDSMRSVLGESILGRAQERGHIEVVCHQIRDYTTNRQCQVDDYPYGGGRGCVMQVQPLYDCWKHICDEAGERVHTIFMSPAGKTFTEADARRLRDDYDRIILVCGHYEGVDERFIELCVDEEISMGDFVLTGGEIPAMAVCDAVSRLVPGVLPDAECYEEESHWSGLLEYPQYSRPEVFEGLRVPDILRTGHHANIARWRQKQSLIRTKLRRPDMYNALTFTTKQEKKLQKEAEEELRIMTREERIEEFAELLIHTGVALQKGQELAIACPVECADFARLCAKKAYEAGCREVHMMWRDDELNRLRFLYGEDDIFDSLAPWLADAQNSLAERGAAWLAIHADDPEALSGVDPDRLRRYSMARGKALAPFRAKEMSNGIRWCVASVPTRAWAMKVFPEKSEGEAVDALWEAILDVSRVAPGGDAKKAWEEHCAEFKSRLEKLNRYNFKSLRYHNSIGTDCTVELPEGHFWTGGSELAQDGVEFCANIPTEEIFTAPKRDGINGTIASALPLVLNGDIADKFVFTVKDGKIVDIQAEKGLELLKGETSVDEGAAYMGEVSLVPCDSPICRSGILFYNTLFDENASCHFAFGEAYASVRGSENMTPEERLGAGLNNSATHIDFMVGTPDLSITGITHDGKEIPVFVNGRYAF